MAATLTAAEVADRIGVRSKHVRRLVATGQLKGYRTTTGRTGYEIDSTSVDDYLARNTVPAPRPVTERPALAEVLGPLYTLDEVAAYLNRSPGALEQDARKGRFTHIKVGRDRRISLPQIEKLIEQSTVRPNERTLTITVPSDAPDLARTRERVLRQQQCRAASARRSA